VLVGCRKKQPLDRNAKGIETSDQLQLVKGAFPKRPSTTCALCPKSAKVICLIKKSIVSFLASMAVTGCASFCEVESFDKITPNNQVADVRSYMNGPRHTVLKLASDVSMDVSSCFTNGLCVEIELPEGRRMQFESNEFVELDAAGVRLIRVNTVSHIFFTVMCEENRKVSRTCSSSELSPTIQPVEVKVYPKSTHEDWTHQIFWKWFDSRLEFVGAREISGSLLRPWLSHAGNRKYEMRIFVDKKPSTDPYIVRFPKVVIDGVSYQLPDIRINNVREKVCRSPGK
jgi:hypothetical protein